MLKVEYFTNLVYYQFYCFIAKMDDFFDRLFLKRLITFVLFTKRMIGLNYYKVDSYEKLKKKRQPSIEAANRSHANIYLTGFVMTIQFNVVWLIVLFDYSSVSIISSHKLIIGGGLLAMNYLFCHRMVYSKDKYKAYHKQFNKLPKAVHKKQALLVWLFVLVNLILFGGLPILIIKLYH